jgi:hypothetical protein
MSITLDEHTLGGTINPGYSKLLKKPINIATALEAHGAYIYDTLKNPDDPTIFPRRPGDEP